MTALSDPNLLEQYAQTRSDEAFAELVSRHANWVYSTALRLVGDRHLADDVTQAVFLVLAQYAGKLTHRSLNGWLFKVTRYSAANAIRSAARRRTHERRAAEMILQTQTDVDSLWDQVTPILDQTLAGLRTADREAILLRYYQQKSLAEVGAALGVSEDNARKRVARAVDKLRQIFHQRGVTAPSEVLSMALLAHATHAVPPMLALIPSAATAGASSIANGATTMLVTAKIKIVAAVILAASLVPVSVKVVSLATAPRPAAPAPVSIAAADPQIAPPPPAAPAITSAVAPSDKIKINEPEIIPFLNSHTDEIVAFDFESLDMDAINLARLRVLGEMGADPDKWEQSNPHQAFSPKLTPVYDKWLGQLRDVGIKKLYLISQSAGSDSAPTGASLIVPLPKGANGDAVLKLFETPQLPSKIIKNCIVCASSTLMHDVETRPAEPRPDLIAGLNALDGSLRHVITVPQVRTARQPQQGLRCDNLDKVFFTDPHWDNVVFFTQTMNAPPNDGSSYVIKCTTPAAAATLADWMKQQVAQFQTHPPKHDGNDENNRYFAAMQNLTVTGDQITATVDGDTFDQAFLLEARYQFLPN